MIGGNKSLLFNAEYQISIADPVRIVAFYDAGQVQDFGQNFAMDSFMTSTGVEPAVLHSDAQRAVPIDLRLESAV